MRHLIVHIHPKTGHQSRLPKANTYSSTTSMPYGNKNIIHTPLPSLYGNSSIQVYFNHDGLPV